MNISAREACLIAEKRSDHEEADNKLVALVESADVPVDHSVMIRSSSGEIDIVLLFPLHPFDGKSLFIDNGN